MKAVGLISLLGCVAVSDCGSAEVHPLDAQDMRVQRGMTHGASVGVLNFSPFAEAGAKASVRRAAKTTCGLTNVPSEEDIQLEGGPTGVSGLNGLVDSSWFIFKSCQKGASAGKGGRRGAGPRRHAALIPRPPPPGVPC